MKFNESLLTNKITENLKKVKNPLDREGKATAIVEALNFFDQKRDWVEKINRDEIISLITNSKDQQVLCEGIIAKVNNTPFTKALKESKKKKETKQKLNESLTKQPLKEEKLEEGTSNFYDHDYLPLLVFLTLDELEDIMRNDSEFPYEDDFENEDDYYSAIDTFRDTYYDRHYKGVCVLDEEQVDDLKFDLDTFNRDTKEIAYELDVNEDGYQEYGDNINLEDIMLTIEPGYYEGAQIKCDYEKSFDYLTEDVKKEQLERFNNFLNQMQKKYGLTKLSVAYRMSNGETGYNIQEELKHLNEGVKKTVKFAVPESEMGSIQKKIDDCGFTINSLGNKAGYDEFEVVGDADKEDCWKVVDDLVKEINTHKNVTFDYLKESNEVLRLANGGFAYISDFDKDSFEKEYVETGKYKFKSKAKSSKGTYNIYSNNVGDSWAVRVDENLKEANDNSALRKISSKLMPPSNYGNAKSKAPKPQKIYFIPKGTTIKAQNIAPFGSKYDKLIVGEKEIVTDKDLQGTRSDILFWLKDRFETKYHNAYGTS